MHCWKSFHVDRKYYFYRRFFISTAVTLFAFILLYVPLQTFASGPLQDNHFFTFLLIFLLLYPIHKIIHLLPIASYYKHLKLEVDFYFYALPILNVRAKNPIPKRRFAASLLFPFIFINITLLMAIYIFPQYVHYVTILLAYHTGLCAVDLTYVKTLFSSPKDSLIEESDDGYEILINDH